MTKNIIFRLPLWIGLIYIFMLIACESSSNEPDVILYQPDTLVAYNFLTKSSTYIIPKPCAYNEDDFTNSYIGSLSNNRAILPGSIPESDLIETSQFTRLRRASLFANIEDYPIRTTVKLLMFADGVNIGSCTGQLIGPRLVMTAGHCVVNINTRIMQYDSIQAVSLFDNGRIATNGKISRVNKAYLFKSFIDRSYDPEKMPTDLALLEIEDALGTEFGYVGIGFKADPNFYRTSIFYKWSYPAIPNPIVPAEKFNGDTLYYNFGLVDILSRGGLGLPNGIPHGAPGQSGSSYMFMDADSNFWIVGVYNMMSQHRHFELESTEFYSLMDIIISDHNSKGK